MTFQLPGALSAQAERKLWRAGILTWEDYRQSGDTYFSPRRHMAILAAIEKVEQLLRSDPSPKQLLTVASPAWLSRLFPILAEHALYLDIETTGLRSYDTITAVTFYYQSQLTFFVSGLNLSELPRAMPGSAVLVSFHGRRFDLPRLRRHFRLPFALPHLDLGALARKLGLPGSLLECLDHLGIPWPRDLPCRGCEAPELWARHQAGQKEALRTLLRYNAWHAVVLERLWATMWSNSVTAFPIGLACQLPPLPDVEGAVRRFLG